MCLSLGFPLYKMGCWYRLVGSYMRCPEPGKQSVLNKQPLDATSLRATHKG